MRLPCKHTLYPHTPSLETLLEFCYACQVTPLQIMRTPGTLLHAIQTEMSPRPRRPQRFTRRPVDRQQVQELLQAILDGRAELAGVTNLARRLGLHESMLWYYFPQECAVVTQRYQEYEKQRRKDRELRVCQEVRQAVITLHAQGVFPSHRKVRMVLSDPNLMRMPQASATWHAVRHELGLE